ncbi:MAG: LCP family protein [Chloroflexota bacterium]
MSDRQTSTKKSNVRPLPLLLGLLAISFLAISGYWTYTFTKRVAAESPIIAQPDIDESVPTQVPDTVINQPVQSVSGTEVTSESIEEEIAVPIVQEAWEGNSRVTILVMGIDRRCDETGPVRTDTLMLLTVDPVGKTAALLSLPRDLWVEIPGFGVDRINQAHYFGEIFEYPGGGPALAVDTVEAVLGTDIHYFGTVNFDAFIDIVDLIGGIEIDVPQAIDDPTYPDECYGFDPFSIGEGTQTLNGEEALKYARTRATADGDLARANRQQLVVMALRDAAVTELGELVVKAPRVWDTLSENVSTTMQLEEAMQLAMLLPDIPRENIRQGVIGKDYVFEVQNSEGQFVLVPRRQAIRDLRDELFAPPGAVRNEATLDQQAKLLEQSSNEGARIAIYNGTQTFGLAGETEDWLNTQGVTIQAVGNDDLSTNVSSRIIEYGDYPATVDLLIDLLEVPPLNIEKGESPPEPDIDVLVILGSRWEVPAE